MHPTEGIWLFRGPVGTNHAMRRYGGPFGHNDITGPASFPTSTVIVENNYKFNGQAPTGSPLEGKKMSTVHSRDSNTVIRLQPDGTLSQTKQSTHTYIDETYMKSLESLQWNRDWGVVELIPIAVVMTEW